MSVADPIHDALAFVQSLAWTPGTPRARAIAALNRALRVLIVHAGTTEDGPALLTLEEARGRSIAAAREIAERVQTAAFNARTAGEFGGRLDVVEARTVTLAASLLAGRWMELEESLAAERVRPPTLAEIMARAPFLSPPKSLSLWREYKGKHAAVRVVPRVLTGNADERLDAEGLVPVAAFWHVGPNRVRSLIVGCARAGGAR